MSIEDWRRKIDEIDRRLVDLLNERSRCVVEIGRVKHASGDALYQPDREKQVLDAAVHANPGLRPPQSRKQTVGKRNYSCRCGSAIRSRRDV